MGSLVLVGPAEAAHVGCGTVITQDATLHGNVGPCTGGGIIIETDGITLNLNGHAVFGTTEPGEGAGILLRQVTGVTVHSGTVARFDGGVVIEGGGYNSIGRITARDNVGRSSSHPAAAPTLYGDGIAVQSSTHNRIVDNHTLGNGPFSGIGLYELADNDHPTTPGTPNGDNLVRNNVVQDNVACRAGATAPFCDNDGIRIEPAVGPRNVIDSNVVRGNGLDGISLFGRTHDNRVTNNSVGENGFNGAVRGDGIRVFGFRNLIQGNQVFANALDGISVGRRGIAPPGSLPAPNGRDNRILDNVTGRNSRVDLYDSNPDCDNNIWQGNVYDLATPACTQG
ncbi:MAG TPA: right-handed parallel beta-helix repeat-containing protein [Acidimicrobiales bacterium]|nr:right-handed parallel beta-helix repeat-containing protein [Acidimicrobiales bacterium]